METFFFVLLALFIAAQAYIILQYVRKKRKDCIQYTAVPSGLFMAYLLAVCLLRLLIPYLVLTLAMISVFLHTFVGTYLNVYRKSKVFDRYLHGFGTFSFALLVYLTLSGITAPGGSVLFRAIYVAALGITGGVLFELMEFSKDRKKGTDMQRGLIDTDFDLLFDVLGAAAAAIVSTLVLL